MKARNASRKHDSPSQTDVRKAIDFMLYVVDTYGERFLPILDSLIADHDAMEKRESSQDRARRLLAAYTLDGGMKAIR